MLKRVTILFLLFLSYGGYIAHATIPHHHTDQEQSGHSHGSHHHHDSDHHHDQQHDSGEENPMAQFWASVVHTPGSTNLTLGHTSSDSVIKILTTPGPAIAGEFPVEPVIAKDHHPPIYSKSRALSFSVTQTPLRAPPVRS